MNELANHVAQAIQDRYLLKPGQAVLIAVSGGLDSMVLLHLLHGLSQQNRWRLIIGHLNHELRGRESDADEQLVRQTARRLRLPAVVERADVRGIAQAHKLSLEMAARKARHEFLARAAAQRQVPSIALAHHADDQLELFFLRLLRGAGGEGLTGMKWRGRSPANPAIELLRPLLDLSKTALREYAVEVGMHFREDASNASLDIQRNRIRHKLLPLLRKEYQPGLDKTVSRLMDLVGAEAELAGGMAKCWLRERGLSQGLAATVQCEKRRRGSAALLPAKFADLPVAVQRRCVQLQLLCLGVAPDFDLVEQLRTTPARAVSIGFGGSEDPGEPCGLLQVVREADGAVRLREASTPAFKAGSKEVELAGGAGKLEFDGARIGWRIAAGNSPSRPKALRGRETFDADAVGSPILLRHWQPGDRFRPIGMKSAIKLQDLFTNQKVPRDQRRSLSVAVSAQGEIFWVEGLRIAERFKLTSFTNRRLQWHWRRH